MTVSLLDTFRVLASFEPKRTALAQAPWEEYTDWSISQGLAPLAAYNLEYRLAGAGAPEWVRDRLMSVYQGALNDNVMKLVNFKRTVDELEGRRILVLGGPAFADALYPHVAFRPVLDIEMLLRPEDVAPSPASWAARVPSRSRTRRHHRRGARVCDGRPHPVAALRGRAGPERAGRRRRASSSAPCR